jgi:hypothetical protein
LHKFEKTKDMKNSILTLLIVIIGSTSFSQEIVTTKSGRKVMLKSDSTWEYVKEDPKSKPSKDNNGLYIGKIIDEMKDKIYFAPSKKLVCINEGSKKAFSISYYFAEENKTPVLRGIDIKVVGIGCIEKTKLYFLFDDGEKFNITSWNKFNCKGNAWFKIKPKHLNLLSSKPLKKIMVENGRDFKSVTYTLEENQKRYFIDLYNSYKEKDIRIMKDSDE